MIPLFTTLAKSITGKIVLGLSVATMGVGAAAAAGAEMPSLTNAVHTEETSDQTTEGSDEDTGELTGEDTGESTGEDTGELTGEDTGESTGEDTGESTGEDTGEQSAAETADAEPTHGEVVSTFTRETELVGCEKGQATAAVARGDVEPSSASLAEDLAPYLARCLEATETDDADEEASDDAVDSDPVEASDAEAGWKDVRDENKDIWHDAKDSFEAACGGDDDGDDEGEDDGEDAELSPECEAMKAELKQLHTDGRTEWHDARDAAHAERKAERAEDKAERAEGKAERATGKGQSGKGEGGKGKSGKD